MFICSVFTKPRKDAHSTRVTPQRPHAPYPRLPRSTTSTRSSHPGFVALFAAFSTLFSPRPASFPLSNKVSSSWSSMSPSSSMLAKRTCFFFTAASLAADEVIPASADGAPSSGKRRPSSDRPLTAIYLVSSVSVLPVCALVRVQNAAVESDIFKKRAAPRMTADSAAAVDPPYVNRRTAEIAYSEQSITRPVKAIHRSSIKQLYIFSVYLSVSFLRTTSLLNCFTYLNDCNWMFPKDKLYTSPCAPHRPLLFIYSSSFTFHFLSVTPS